MTSTVSSNSCNGKELSYNNLVDVDAAVNLVKEFNEETAFVIIKHTNACGVATAPSVKEAYLKAFQADTISAFGGVLATNKTIDLAAAEEINKLFFEILIAPAYDANALDAVEVEEEQNDPRCRNSPSPKRVRARAS